MTLFGLPSAPAPEANALPATHTCHWPGCKVPVPPKMWGCKAHWFRLPGVLRHAIWKSYRPGQEIDKRPSEDYMLAAARVREWIATTHGEVG